MSFLIIRNASASEYVVITYRRPKGESLVWATAPAESFGASSVEAEIFNRLGTDLVEDRAGVDRNKIKLIELSRHEEKALLANAKAIQIHPKRKIGGILDVFRLVPSVIAELELHRVVDKDPALNIEIDYPLSFAEFHDAFRTAFERAG